MGLDAAPGQDSDEKRFDTAKNLLGIVGIGAALLLWVASLSFHVADILSGRLVWTPIYVKGDGDAVIVTGFWDGADRRGELRVGDHIARVGDIIPSSRFDFMAAAVVAHQDAQLTVTVQRDEGLASVSVALQPVELPIRQTAMSVAFGLIGLVIALKARRSDASYLFAGSMLMYGAHSAYFFGSTPETVVLGLCVLTISSALYWSLGLNAIQRISDQQLPTWQYFVPWVLVVSGLTTFAWVTGIPYGGPYAQTLALLLNPISFFVAAAVYVVTYRGTDEAGRRALRWVAFGMSAALIPIALGAVVGSLLPEAVSIYMMSLTFTLLIPLAIAVAILRADLFNVDRVVSGAIAYAIVISMVALALEFIVEPLVTLLAQAVTVPESIAQAVFVVAGALAARPVQRSLKPFIQRFFNQADPNTGE